MHPAVVVAIVVASLFIVLEIVLDWWRAWRRDRAVEEKRFVDRG